MLNLEFPLIELHIESIDAWSDQYYSEERLPQDYPYCCEEHKKLAKEIYDWWDKFPLCCDAHKKLLLDKNFKKDKYSYAPKKILNQLAFFRKHINLNIDKPNWFNDIKDYYIYVADTFGKPSIGLGLFNQYIKINLLSLKNLPDCTYDHDKLQKIVNFIHEYNSPKSKRISKNDLKELYSIFAKWVDIVPNIGPFVNLKTNIQGKFPINLMFKDPHFNKYLNCTLSKPKTYEELNNDLLDLTLKALNSIKSEWFVNNNKLVEFQKFNIDVISENHRLRQKKLLNEFSQSQYKYINVIEEWLKNEQTYFNEITPALKQIVIKNSDPKINSSSWFKYKEYSDSENIKDLHDGLTKLGCIKDKYLDFKKVVSGNPVEKKVVWCGNIGDLASFIKELESQEKIYKVRYKWITAVNSFCDQDYNSFDPEKLRNAKQTLNYKKIKKLVSYL